LLLSQTNDYTLSGSTITFVPGVAPEAGDVLLASYRTATTTPNLRSR